MIGGGVSLEAIVVFKMIAPVSLLRRVKDVITNRTRYDLTWKNLYEGDFMHEDNHELKSSGLKNIFRRIMTFIPKMLPFVPEIVAILICAVASTLGFLNIWRTDFLLSVFFAVFAFIVLFFIALRSNLNDVSNRVRKASADMEKSNESLSARITSLTVPSIDNVFTRSSDSKETEIIKRAQNEILLLQETGATIIEKNNTYLRSFLDNGGKLKILSSSDSASTVESLLLRNANLNRFSDIRTRMAMFDSQVRNLCYNNSSNSAINVSVRYCPYPVALTAIIGDPTSISDANSNRKSTPEAVIRWADFLVPYAEKLDVYVNAVDDPSICNFYITQFKNYSKMSHKKLVITGEPHIGKTTIIKNLLEESKRNPDIFFVLSEEKMIGTERVGYSVVTSNNSTPQQFARKKKADEPSSEHQTTVGDYIIDVKIWDDIANDIANNKHKIVIIDEIGHMQLRSAKFSKVIRDLIDTKNGTIIGSITLSNDDSNTINDIKNNVNVECININQGNRDDVLSALKDELVGSIRLHRILREGKNE